MPGCGAGGVPRPEPGPARPRPPQASAYLRQNKYQQAEELYKQILSREDLPAPLGEPPVPPRPPGGFLVSPPQCPRLSPRSPQHRQSWQRRTGEEGLCFGSRWAGTGWGVGTDWRLGPQTLRRSSSFSKLRESIRRGSEKLVSRLRGEGMAGAAG